MMFDNHIKESPFLGFAGFGGGISWDSIQKYIDAVYYVEEVFSTYVYEGDGNFSTPGTSIVNGIDLAGEGGMVWIKIRDQADSHGVHDTERGINSYVSTDSDAAEASGSGGISVSAFNSDGFDVRSWAPDLVNVSDEDYVSWTFRKTPGFFDVVTYTGDGVAGRTVAHNLGSAPGMIWVKRTNGDANWAVYHRSQGATKWGILNTNDEFNTNSTVWNDTEPTSTEFTVGSVAVTNTLNDEYVAYVFAHDDARFGDNSDQSIIKCGGYTGNGLTAGPVIDLGWEPQWVMIKRTDAANGWLMYDNIRGWAYEDTGEYLQANTSGSAQPAGHVSPLSNGFQLFTASGAFNASGGTYIYMAIRRGLMKTPTDATTVFAAAAGQNVTIAGDLAYNSGFPIDWIVEGWDIANYAYDRFMPTYDYLRPSVGGAAAADGGYRSLASNEGSPYDITYNLPGQSAVGWCFRRAPGFFDMVAYTGTGSTRTVDHSLGVAPEMMIVKAVDSSLAWIVYSATTTATDRIVWNQNNSTSSNSGYWNNTEPTSSVFSVGTQQNTNQSGVIFHAYLFASLDGISKVGSYTGNGGTQNIDCGFAAGARFVMIKRTDDTGNWFVWDTTTGIVAGNEDYRKIDDGLLVSGTDYIDPFSSGFALSSAGSSTTNVNTATYIYLAIA